ncbi:MAG: DUF342 domain-containing protein [Phycisphaerae bacterium]
MTAAIREDVQVEISPDHLRAWIRLAADQDHAPPTHDELTEALALAKVPVDDPTSARIKELLEAVAQGEWPEQFLVAEGRPASEGSHGRFIPVDDEQPQSEESQESDRIDYRSLHSIRTVEENTVIGTIVPPVAGQPGVDVHGHILQPTQRVQPVTLQANVRLADDGKTVMATKAGRVVAQDGTVCVRDILEVPGDVDFSVGNIKATSDVSIVGTVNDLFEVAGEKSIFIGGAVEAACIEAGESVRVRGGILSRLKGKVRAGANVSAKFCDEADIQAGQDIEIAKEAVNSRLHAEGALRMAGAAIVGGRAYARQGAEIGTLGSAGGKTTLLIVGIHPTALKKAAEMDSAIKKQAQALETARQRIAPLMNNLKRLNAQQREMVTELNYHAEELDQKLRTQRQAQQDMLTSASSDTPVSVLINRQIHPNSAVVIDGREARFDRDLKGPVRLELRSIKHVTELVAVNMLTGSVTTLKSSAMDLLQVEDDSSDPQAAAQTCGQDETDPA